MAEQTMVERVARALDVNHVMDLADDAPCGYGPAFIAAEKANLRRKARLAIAAMREPTDAMLLQGAITGTRLMDNVDMKCAKEDADSAWQAMISAALKPPAGE